MSTVSELAQRVVELAKAKEYGSVEAYVSYVQELDVEVGDGQIENLQQASETGLSVRVIRDQRLGFSYTTDLSDAGLGKVLTEAVETSRVVPEDDRYALAHSAEYEGLDLYDETFRSLPIEEKIQIAKEIEEVAKSYDPRVSKVRMSRYSERNYQVAIANTLGLSAYYKGTGYSGSLLAIAEADEASETGWGFNFSYYFKDINPRTIGEEAAERGVQMLGARKVASQKADIVLDPLIGTEFLGVIAPALTGDAIQKGKSLFQDKLGKSVASQAVTIVDDGRQTQGGAAAPVDDEGVPTGKTDVVVNGELTNFLYDLYTAAKAGVASTGNGMRSGYRGRPGPSPSNFYLLPGTKSKEEIISGIDRGLYVTSVMGMHTANPISGDFSLGASGLWIEKGEVVYPVRGVAIAGNLVDFLKSIVEVGKDLRFVGGYGSPTVRVGGISISG